MSLIAALRRHQSRAARLAAAVFAIGWLGFAVAPCQAGDLVPHEAPHHGSMPMNDCGHCPPATDTAPDCADAAPADCLSAAQPAIELRQVGQPQPLAIVPAVIDFSAAEAPPTRPPCPADGHAAPSPRASLQQRYCSYLK
jgi:hypothetical protein